MDAWLSIAVAAAEAPAPVLVDQVTAIVAEEILTASDVRIDETLTLRLGPFVEAATGLPALDRAVIELVLRLSAADVPSYRPTGDEVARELDRLRAADWSSEGGLQAFMAREGLGQADLERRVTGRLVAARYVQRNVPPGQDALAWMDERRADVRVRFAEPVF